VRPPLYAVMKGVDIGGDCGGGGRVNERDELREGKRGGGERERWGGRW
jgi:hypothetical protein